MCVCVLNDSVSMFGLADIYVQVCVECVCACVCAC